MRPERPVDKYRSVFQTWLIFWYRVHSPAGYAGIGLVFQTLGCGVGHHSPVGYAGIGWSFRPGDVVGGEVDDGIEQ